MPGYGEQIDVHLLNIRGDFPCSLGRIGVDTDAFLSGQQGNLPYGLKGPHLVVGMHDGNQYRVRPDGGSNIFHMDPTGVIHIHAGDIETLALQVFADLQNCRVFHSAGNDMTAFFLQDPGHAFDGVVVGLGAAGSKKDFFWPAIEHARHLLPGFFKRSFRANTVPVRAGWVAEFGFQEGLHGCNHFRVVGCGAVVVEIDGVWHALSPF